MRKNKTSVYSAALSPASKRTGLAVLLSVVLMVLAMSASAFAGSGGVGTSGGDGGGDRQASSNTGGRYAQIWERLPANNRRWAKRTGECESGNDPDAVNRSGPYYGAFQFLRSTWRTSPGSPGGNPVRYTWKTQAVVAVKLMKRDGKGHWPVCGRR